MNWKTLKVMMLNTNYEIHTTTQILINKTNIIEQPP